MDEKLEALAGHVKDKEYKELFPDTEVEKAKIDEEKVREALFQVHGIIFNKDLFAHCRENSHVTQTELEEMARNEKQLERINKSMGAITMVQEDGETLIPSTDVKYALTKKQGLWD